MKTSFAWRVASGRQRPTGQSLSRSARLPVEMGTLGGLHLPSTLPSKGKHKTSQCPRVAVFERNATFNHRGESRGRMGYSGQHPCCLPDSQRLVDIVIDEFPDYRFLGTLWSSPASQTDLPASLRVRRDAGERPTFAPEAFQSFPSRPEKRQPAGFVVKKRRRLPNSRSQEEEVAPEERERHGAWTQPGLPLIQSRQVSWCGLADCHYPSLDSALFALHRLLSDGMSTMASRMESSEKAAERVGDRLAEEVKMAGATVEEVLAAGVAGMKEASAGEGESNREAWRALGEQVSERLQGVVEQLKSDGEKGRSGTMEQSARIGRSVGEVRSQLATTGEESKGGNAQLMTQLVTGLSHISQQLRVAGEGVEGRLEGLGSVLTTELQDIRGQLEKEGGENSLVVREVKAELQQLTRQVELVGSEGRKQAEVDTDKLVNTGYQVITGLYNMTHEERNQLTGIQETMERASETAVNILEEQTRSQEDALEKVTLIVQRTGAALVKETENAVSQMSKTSELESKNLGTITQELQTIGKELETQNDERKMEARANIEKLDEFSDVLKYNLGTGAERVAAAIQSLNSNISRGFYEIQDNIENIPKEIENLSRNIKENFGNSLADIDNTIKESFEEANLNLEKLPNIRFDTIEDALDNINKDLTSKLGVEAEKLRNSIRDVGQVLVLRKRSLQREDEYKQESVLQSYLKSIVEQNQASATERKFRKQSDEVRDLRAQLSTNSNFDKIAEKTSDLSFGLTGLQNILSRNAQVSQLGSQVNGLNAGLRNFAQEALSNRDVSTFLLLNQQNKPAQEQIVRQELLAAENRFARQQHENQEWQRNLQNQISNRQAFEGLGSEVAGVSGNINHLRGAFSTDTNINTLIAGILFSSYFSSSNSHF